MEEGGGNPSVLLGGTGRFSETFTLQLIKTGNIVPGDLSGLRLIPFWWYVPGRRPGSALSAAPVLGGGTQGSVPACVGNASADFSVVLPGAATRALAADGAQAGRTPLQPSLGGPAKATGAVAMQSSRPSAAVIGLSEP